MKSGIYKIINKINGKFYLGRTNNFYFREKLHFSRLRNNKHYSGHLQNAWNLYGEENFIFEVLEEVEPIQKKLIEREQYWIDILKPYDPKIGYNSQKNADNPLLSNESKKKSLETRRNNSNILTWDIVNIIRKVYYEDKKTLKNIYLMFSNIKERRIRSIIDYKCWVPDGGKPEEYIKWTKKEPPVPITKLTQDIVNEIRIKYQTNTYTQKELAKMFGVRQTQISRIINNISWKKIDG